MPSVQMLHDKDPREAILDKVGDLSGVEIFGNDILVATYIRPERTKSGIILTQQHVAEDRYQSKCYLILKMGPTAFIDEEGNEFRDIRAGDWIIARASDGWAVTLNTGKSGVSRDDALDCRIIPDVSIRARVSHPDLVF